MKPQEMLERGRFLGEEFILWLWMRGLAHGGESGDAEDRSSCFVDDSVQLVNERGDVKELALRKGNPAESREAFEALSRGMRPSRAKLRLLARRYLETAPFRPSTIRFDVAGVLAGEVEIIENAF